MTFPLTFITSVSENKWSDVLICPHVVRCCICFLLF